MFITGRGQSITDMPREADNGDFNKYLELAASSR